MLFDHLELSITCDMADEAMLITEYHLISPRYDVRKLSQINFTIYNIRGDVSLYIINSSLQLGRPEEYLAILQKFFQIHREHMALGWYGGLRLVSINTILPLLSASTLHLQSENDIFNIVELLLSHPTIKTITMATSCYRSQCAVQKNREGLIRNLNLLRCLAAVSRDDPYEPRVIADDGMCIDATCFGKEINFLIPIKTDLIKPMIGLFPNIKTLMLIEPYDPNIAKIYPKIKLYNRGTNTTR